MKKLEEMIASVKKIVLLLQEIIKTTEYVNLKNSNFEEYKNSLIDIAPIFAQKYPTLFDTVINGDDVSLLDVIFKGHMDKEKGIINNEQMEEQISKEMCDIIFDEKYLN